MTLFRGQRVSNKSTSRDCPDTKADGSKVQSPPSDALALGEVEIREVRRLSLAVTAIVFFPSVAAIYLYAHFGGPWVDQLDEQIGEVVALRAKAMANAGRTLEAIDTYQEALAVRFDDPRQRVWKSQELIVLLIQEEMYDQGLRAAGQLFEVSAPYGLVAFRDIQKTPRSTGHHEQALALAQDWFAWAKEKGYPAAMAVSKCYMGLAYLRMGQDDQAAESALDAFRIDPTPETASIGARLLRDSHRGKDALPLLDFWIKEGDDSLRAEPEAIKRGILGK